MTFRKFLQNKLWRDKAVDWLEQAGSKIHWTKLEDDAFLAELKVKFLEEAQEVCSAKTKDALLEELADVLEVMTSLCDVHQVTLEDIVQIQKGKRNKRGSFEGRKYVTIAEHPPGSLGEKYCLADPEKYPEV
jgi:predicted house-cleaning noncanonical NTP pyrophosphatase (MazG superfamily)